MLEERHGLVVHRRFDLVGELGEALGVDAAILIEAVEPEPLAEELRGEAPRLRVGQHALHLRAQDLVVAQLAGGGRRRSSASGTDDHRKKLSRLASSQSFERLDALGLLRLLEAIEEGRRDQNARDQGSHRLRWSSSKLFARP